MSLKYLKIYHYFWITAVLILITGICREHTTNNILDINIHDTYFIITNFDVTIFLTIAYLLMGFGYWLVQKLLNRGLIHSLTLIHTGILLGSFIIYWLASMYSFFNPPYLFDSYFSSNTTLIISLILILFIGLPVYIINLFIGIFRKKASDNI